MKTINKEHKKYIDIIIEIHSGIIEKVNVFSSKEKAQDHYNKWLRSHGYISEEVYINDFENGAPDEIHYYEDITVIK